jgi:hypothetical protein
VRKPWTRAASPTTLDVPHLDRSEAAMRLGRRLSAGIAEDPPETREAPDETPAPVERVPEATAERREPAEQLADR